MNSPVKLALLCFQLAAIVSSSCIPFDAVIWFDLKRVVTLSTNVVLGAVGKVEAIMKRKYLDTVRFLKWLLP
jgi:hypothetical protein